MHDSAEIKRNLKLREYALL